MDIFIDVLLWNCYVHTQRVDKQRMMIQLPGTSKLKKDKDSVQNYVLDESSGTSILSFRD